MRPRVPSIGFIEPNPRNSFPRDLNPDLYSLPYAYIMFAYKKMTIASHWVHSTE